MGTIIGFYNRKGGCGKTTSLFNIAAEMAFQGKKILLVDGDSQCNLSDLIIDDTDPEESLNLYDLLTNASILKPYKKIISFKKRIGNTYKTFSFEMDIIKGSEELDYLESDINVLKTKLSSFKDTYDYIFIDFPPGNTFNTMMYLVACDYILAPMNLAKDNTTKAYIKLISKCREAVEVYGNKNLEILGAYYTGVQIYKSDQKQVYDMTMSDDYKDALKLFTSTIRYDYKNVQAEESFQLPIIALESGAPIVQDIRNLTNEIRERLGD